MEKRAGVEPTLNVEGIERLPALVEEGLFHMAHEALNNSLKHAAASQVIVSIKNADGKVELEIQLYMLSQHIYDELMNISIMKSLAVFLALVLTRCYSRVALEGDF